MSLLQMKHICKSFSGVYANEDINLTVEKGEIHALLGENGAGKTTLVNIIFGLYTADSGEILWKTSQRILPLQGKLSMQALEWSSSIFPW